MKFYQLNICLTKRLTSGQTMKLKKRKENRNKFIGFRVTEREYNEIKLRAGLYSKGIISEWVATSAIKYRPSKDDLDGLKK